MKQGNRDLLEGNSLENFNVSLDIFRLYTFVTSRGINMKVHLFARRSGECLCAFKQAIHRCAVFTEVG